MPPENEKVGVSALNEVVGRVVVVLLREKGIDVTDNELRKKAEGIIASAEEVRRDAFGDSYNPPIAGCPCLQDAVDVAKALLELMPPPDLFV